MLPPPTNGKLAPVIRQQAINFAVRHVGAPYRHQGRSINYGIDCIGMIYCAYAFAGFKADIPSDYGYMNNQALILSYLSKYCSPIDEPCLGDILIFRVKQSIQHMAMSSKLGMVHCCQKNRGIIDEPISNFWRKRMAGCFRVNL